MLASLAPGRSIIRGALTSEDARSSARVLRQLGAGIAPFKSGADLSVSGHRKFSASSSALDCGNSGTTARLMLGLLAAHRFTASITGDKSLRRRPMRRVTEPLAIMGATVVAGDNDGLPLRIRGGELSPLDWRLPVASAQIKSALLLAGAIGGVPVTLHEPAPSRDHTERMLRHFGFEVDSPRGGTRLRPTGKLEPFNIEIPGDPSSAIFLLAAAALAGGGNAIIDGVGLNPSRIGYLSVLHRMGIAVAVQVEDESFGEPRGSIVASASEVQPVEVDADEVPGIIDEVPMLACLAARATGVSRFRGLAELRVKESDRLALMAGNLVAIGVNAVVEADDLIVEGTHRALRGAVTTLDDHRIAMAFTVLGTIPGSRIRVDNPGCAVVSFPRFPETLRALFSNGRK